MGKTQKGLKCILKMHTKLANKLAYTLISNKNSMFYRLAAAPLASLGREGNKIAWHISFSASLT